MAIVVKIVQKYQEKEVETVHLDGEEGIPTTKRWLPTHLRLVSMTIQGDSYFLHLSECLWGV